MMKNFLYFAVGILILVLTALLIWITVLKKKVNSVSADYIVKIERLDKKTNQLEAEREVLLTTIEQLKDSLANQKTSIEYVYVQIDSVKEQEEALTPNEIYTNLQETFPVDSTVEKKYPFAEPQIADLHLAVTERGLYRDLATKLQEALNTSDDIIKSQNEALLSSEKQIALEKLKTQTLKEQLDISARKVQRKTITNYVLGAAVIIEGIVIAVLQTTN